MSNDYLSSLPEEMLEEISNFFEVYDYNEPHESYRALAQTCKSLRAHFQRRLFSFLYLPAEPDIRTFAELIRDNPNLASYIRTIRLEVDDMCMGHFQYLPLLAIIRAASSSGTPPEILLSMGFFSNFFDSDELGFNLPSNTITHTLDAPQIILHAITNLHVRNVEQAIPVGLFRLLPNLLTLCGSSFALPSDDSLEEDHTTQFFRPKLNVLMLISCNPATIKMLCEQILDLSALKEFVVSDVHTGTTDPNAKRLLAWRILDHAQSVQKLQLDIGVGPFYDLGRLQNLRKCTFDLEVDVNANSVPHLCQLLRTLPPLPQHDLEYLHLSFEFIDILLDENDIASSHVLFSVGTWISFDAALVDIVASGARPFKLALFFCIPTPNNTVEPILKSLFVDWERKYLPKSSRQRNLTINFQHSYPY